MKIVFLVIVTVFLIFLAFLPNYSPTFAHQSGCHRWHSCPSDTGSYTCGDAGYSCRYPTYPKDGGYIPPTEPYVPTPKVTQPTSNSGGGIVQGTQTTNASSNDDAFWDWVIGLGLLAFVIGGVVAVVNENKQKPT